MSLAHWFIKNKKVTLKRCLSYCYKLSCLISFPSKATGSSDPTIQNNLKALAFTQKKQIIISLHPYDPEDLKNNVLFIQAKVGQNDPLFLGFLAPKYYHILFPIYHKFKITSFQITGGPIKAIPYRYYGFNFKITRLDHAYKFNPLNR